MPTRGSSPSAGSTSRSFSRPAPEPARHARSSPGCWPGRSDRAGWRRPNDGRCAPGRSEHGRRTTTRSLPTCSTGSSPSPSRKRPPPRWPAASARRSPPWRPVDRPAMLPISRSSMARICPAARVACSMHSAGCGSRPSTRSVAPCSRSIRSKPAFTPPSESTRRSRPSNGWPTRCSPTSYPPASRAKATARCSPCSPLEFARRRFARACCCSPAKAPRQRLWKTIHCRRRPPRRCCARPRRLCGRSLPICSALPLSFPPDSAPPRSSRPGSQTCCPSWRARTLPWRDSNAPWPKSRRSSNCGRRVRCASGRRETRSRRSKSIVRPVPLRSPPSQRRPFRLCCACADCRRPGSQRCAPCSRRCCAPCASECVAPAQCSTPICSPRRRTSSRAIGRCASRCGEGSVSC